MSDLKIFIKNIYVRCKFYGLRKSNGAENVLLFIIDDGYFQKHPGFVDRMKAIVGAYYLAVQNQREFRLVFNVPFPIQEYLQPCEVDWRPDGDISYALGDTKLMVYRPQEGLIQLETSVKQYHIYFYEGLNVLKYCDIKDWKKTWNVLYHKLFKPTELLQRLCREAVPKKPYIAVHLRFVNLLEKFEEGFDRNISDEAKHELVERCLRTLIIIREREKDNIVVFSDSKIFLDFIVRQGFMCLDSRKVGHVSFQTEREVYEKTLVDFYAISGAEKVYAIRGGNLYNSAFPEYAAIVGDKPFIIEYV